MHYDVSAELGAQLSPGRSIVARKKTILSMPPEKGDSFVDRGLRLIVEDREHTNNKGGDCFVGKLHLRLAPETVARCWECETSLEDALMARGWEVEITEEGPEESEPTGRGMPGCEVCPD